MIGITAELSHYDYGSSRKTLISHLSKVQTLTRNFVEDIESFPRNFMLLMRIFDLTLFAVTSRGVAGSCYIQAYPQC